MTFFWKLPNWDMALCILSWKYGNLDLDWVLKKIYLQTREPFNILFVGQRMVCVSGEEVIKWWWTSVHLNDVRQADVRQRSDHFPVTPLMTIDHLVTWSGCHQPAVRILIGYNHQTLVASDCKGQTCRGMVRATAGRQCHRFKSVCCSVADIAAGRNNCD